MTYQDRPRDIVSLSVLTFGSLIALGSAAAAQATFPNQDVLIDGSLCVGIDCVLTGENFGSDTIRLKENNLRIHFDDTSTTGSFPFNDWRITINGQQNGDPNFFAIDDATAGTTPFRISAGAGNNALIVDDNGDVGIGTATPVLELHIADGDSPSIRLEQNNSSGFAAQTWDVAANETNFFIRDVNTSSNLPFRIQQGAQYGTLVVGRNGTVGIGFNGNAFPNQTTSPALEVRGVDGRGRLLVSNNSNVSAARNVAEFVNFGRPDLVLANGFTGDEWSIGGGTNIVMKSGALGSDPSAKTTRFTLTNSGDLTITGSLVTGGPSCSGGCDAVYSPDYDLPTISEHVAAMYSLGYLPNVGATVPGEPMDLTDKIGRMLNELEHAHIYIGQLHDQLASERDKIATLENRLDRVEGGDKTAN
ncbi:MAG: hypothetical protein R3D45_13825 [Rhizobiaceae bacterium]